MVNHPSCRHPAQRGQRRVQSSPLTHAEHGLGEGLLCARFQDPETWWVGNGLTWSCPHRAHSPQEVQTNKRAITTAWAAWQERAAWGSQDPKI